MENGTDISGDASTAAETVLRFSGACGTWGLCLGASAVLVEATLSRGFATGEEEAGVLL